MRFNIQPGSMAERAFRDCGFLVNIRAFPGTMYLIQLDIVGPTWVYCKFLKLKKRGRVIHSC